MADFFKSLDWTLRMGIAASVAVLSALLLWITINLCLSGPWMLAVVTGAISAFGVNVCQQAWPSKMPPELEPLQDFIDKWKQAKARSTKSKAGAFVWSLGRAAFGAMLAWQVLGFWYGFASSVRWLAVVGFGGAFGFFGLEAALWSGLVIGAVAQLATSFGLGEDFADRARRSDFLIRWSVGVVKMSWLWPIGFALCAPAWIGVAAMFRSVKAKISEEMAERKTAAADKKRIDARRLRMRVRNENGGEDPLDKARKKLEEAQERVKAVGRGHAAPAISEESDGAVVFDAAANELTGVKKLENDNMVAMLRRYATQVREIRKTEASGIDVNSAARTSFDRVIQGMSDAWLEHLRRDKSEDGRLLLAYYDQLCSVEDAALRGGDGEVVISSGLAWNEEDAIDGIAGYDEDLGGGSGDLLDEEDQLDEEFAAPSGRGALAASEMSMMLSGSVHEGDDGTPSGEGVLPVEDDVSEEETKSMSPETITGPEELGEDPGPPSEAVIIVEGDEIISVIREEVQGVDDDRGDEVDEVDQVDSAVEPVIEDDVDEGHDESEAIVDDVTHESEALATVSAPVAAAVEVAPVAQPSVVEATVLPRASDIEIKRAAGVILSGKTDREFVLRTTDWFPNADAAATALGVDADIFAESFASYDAKVSAARVELALGVALAAEDATIETITAAADSLEATGWEFDAALVGRARSWVADQIEAARLKEEQERLQREEEERLQREEEERLQREEEERLQREETARLAREEEERLARVAREEEEQRALLAREEEERRAKLEGQRSKIAVCILAGKLDDEVLVTGSELFQNVEALAETLDLPIEIVQLRFEDFSKRNLARIKYDELAEAFRLEDVGAVETLLEDRAVFEAYEHPTVKIEGMARWAEGVRERDRMRGLIDGEVRVGTIDQSEARRIFMRKRLGVGVEIAQVIESELPQALKLFRMFETTITMMGDAVTGGIQEAAEAARMKARGLAATVVLIKEGKGCARQYVEAFLPQDVRLPNVEPWDMLLELAEGADPVAATPVAEVEAPVEQAAPEPAAVEVEPPAEVEPEQPAQPAKARGGITFSPRRERTLDDIQKLDPVEMVRQSGFEGRFNMELLQRQQVIALREIYGDAVDKRVTISEGDVYAQIVGPDMTVRGRVWIRTDVDALAWYDAKMGKVLMKSVEGGKHGKVRSVSREALISPLRIEVRPADGDPDTVIGLAIVSPIISEDGVLSFQPVLDDLPKSVRILTAQESVGDGLRNFVRSISEAL